MADTTSEGFSAKKNGKGIIESCKSRAVGINELYGAATLSSSSPCYEYTFCWDIARVDCKGSQAVQHISSLRLKALFKFLWLDNLSCPLKKKGAILNSEAAQRGWDVGLRDCREFLACLLQIKISLFTFPQSFSLYYLWWPQNLILRFSQMLELDNVSGKRCHGLDKHSHE